MLRAPAIPDLPSGLPTGHQRLLAAMKERLEILYGERGVYESVLDQLASLEGAETIDDDSVAYEHLTDATTTALFRKNAVINGDFNVWQRGTSFASAATGAFSADRWAYHKVGAMVHDLSRSTDVPTVVQAGRLFNYSLLIDCTTTDASLAAGDFCAVRQAVEGYNWLPFAQRACTLSFWVKATKTGTYCVSLRNSGLDRSFVREYMVNAADTWELKTVVFDASPSAGTWDYTNGVGTYVTWALASGTDFHGDAGSWNSANDIATSSQVNACDSTSNNFRLVGVQLEAGEIATAFDRREFQAELDLCQRYYQKTYNLSVAAGAVTTAGGVFLRGPAGVSNFFNPGRFLVRMRAAPTMAIYSLNGTSGNVSDTASAYTHSADAAATIQTIGEVGFIGVALDSVTAPSIGFHYTADAEL